MNVLPSMVPVTDDVPLNVIVIDRVVVLPAFGPAVTVTVHVRAMVPDSGQPLPPSEVRTGRTTLVTTLEHVRS